MGDETLAPPLATVRIEPDGSRTKVILAGQDVSALLHRVSIDITAGKPPQVFLELGVTTPPEAIECEAIVTVIREIHQDPAEAMLSFLENIDPEELDRCILEQMGGLGELQTYGVVCLQVMRGWSSGH